MYSRLMNRSGFRAFHAQTRASTIWALPPVLSHIVIAPSTSDRSVVSQAVTNSSPAALVVVPSPALVVVSSGAALVVLASPAALVVVSSAPLSAQAAITMAMTMASKIGTDGPLLRWAPCFLVVTRFSSLLGDVR